MFVMFLQCSYSLSLSLSLSITTSTLCILFVCKEISFLGIVSLFVWSTLFVFWGSMHLFVCLCMYLSGLTAWAFDFFLRAKAVYAVSWRVLGTLCVYLSMQRMYLSVHLSIFICSYSNGPVVSLLGPAGLALVMDLNPAGVVSPRAFSRGLLRL